MVERRRLVVVDVRVPLLQEADALHVRERAALGDGHDRQVELLARDVVDRRR